MMKNLIFIIVIIYCLSIYAVEPDSLKAHPEPKYLLEGASITAEKPTQAIGKIFVKTFDERIINSKTNIAEAVSDIPGINISQGGKNNSELSIRGFAKEDVMIMIDGRPIGGGYFDAVDLSSLPVADIKEIQVIKGPASALYGTNTMGGVINIISAKPDNSTWINAKMQVQRNYTRYYKLTSAHKFNNWDYLVSLAHYQTDGFTLAENFMPVTLENGGIRDNSAQNHNDLHAKINYQLNDLHQIGFTASYTLMDEREIPTATNEFYNPAYPDDIFRKFVDWKRYQFSTLGNFVLGWNQKLSYNIYYDGYDDIYQTFLDPDYTVMSLNSRLLSTNIGSVIKYSLEQDRYDLIAGYRIEKQAFNRKDNEEYQQWTNNWQILQNPFCQMELDLSKLKFTLGTGLSVFYQNQRDNWIYHLEPSLGLFYETESFGQYNLAVSNNVNYPALHELFSDSSGNPDLKEESAWKFELSTQQPFTADAHAGSIELSTFYNAVSDMVEKVYHSNYSLYENIDQVNSYGYEAAFKLKYLIEYNIQYRYLQYDKNSDKPLYENPPNIINISEKALLPYDFFIVWDASWHDKSHSDDKVLPSYWLHDFYLNKTFGKYKVKLGIENAFDQNYQEKYGYPQPGRDLILTLEASI